MSKMFSTKKDIDKHVKTQLAKLSENEKNDRGYTIAKLYFKVGEYETALHWVSCFLKARETNPQAHKLLGQCFEKLKKPERALTAYQRSLQLDPKQQDLITDVCKLLLNEDTVNSNPSRAKYWCDLAERERIQNESVLNLRMQVAGKTDNKIVEQLILQEIQKRPTDPGLRVRLVKYLIEEKRYPEAFKQCFEIEMKFIDSFAVSIDWYNVVNMTLAKYGEADKGCLTSWNYWLLSVLALERQVFLNLASETLLINTSRNNLKGVTALLFEFDQLLRRASDSVMTICPIRELAAQFLYHYRGQFLLHAASLLFKTEKIYTRNQWRDTTKRCLPLLLLAYQCGTADTDETWLRTSNDQIRALVKTWHLQGAFRCAQAGRTLLSCISEGRENPVIAQIRQVTNNRNWETQEDIITQIRQHCIDPNWRKNTFRHLLSTGDQVLKPSTSYFVQCDTMAEPSYEFPSVGDVESYEDIAQSLQPSALHNQVYLNLGVPNLSEVRSMVIQGLKYTVSNLSNCGSDTINQLDMDSFLCCTILQTKRSIDAEKLCYETYNDRPYDKPSVLPITNMMEILCTEDQSEWWQAVYKLLKNSAGENIAQMKAVLQNGIEAVRGEGPLKVDLPILLKLSKTLAQRSQSAMQVEEKRALESRAEHLYKTCLRHIKKGANTGEYRLLFKLSSQNYNVENEIKDLAEDAVQFLAAKYFKTNQLNELIDEFEGIDFPFATYFRAEAYKKLDETGKISKKVKMMNLEKTKSCLLDTLQLLDNPYYKNHPLHSIVPSEIKRLQYSTGDMNVSNGLGGSFYGNEDERDPLNISVRSRTHNTSFSDKTVELENLIRKMMETLDIVKKEVVTIRGDVTDMQVKINKIEDNMSKKAAADEADLNDLYILDELQNQSQMQYDSRGTPIQTVQQMQQNEIFAQAARLSQYSQMYNTAYPMYMPPYGTPTLPPAAIRPTAHAIGGAIASPLQYPDPNLMQEPRNSLLMTATQPYYNSPQTNPITQVAPIMTTQPQVPAPPKSALEQALQTPSLLNTWNTTYNQVIDKSPPVNVVITSSDPLPAYNTVTAQPKLSVTIPAQHIKSNQAIPPAEFNNKNNIAAGFASGIEIITPPSEPLQNIGNINTQSNNNQTFNTSTEYTAATDYAPTASLPAEIDARTGDENEEIIFSSRAKLFIHVNKSWKERGVGDIKILKIKQTGQFQILMRREQVHKVCANHQIEPEMKLIAPKDTDTQFIWTANDYTEGILKIEKFLVRFKEADIAKLFQTKFEDAKKEIAKIKPKTAATVTPASISTAYKTTPNLFNALTSTNPINVTPTVNNVQQPKPFGGFTGSITVASTTSLFSTPTTTTATPEQNKSSPFASFTFGKVNEAPKPFVSLFGNIGKSTATDSPMSSTPITVSSTSFISSTVSSAATISTPKANVSLNKSADDEDDYVPTATFTPVIPLPELVETVTGEENEDVAFEKRAKLYRYDRSTKEWKERGLGNIKILINKANPNKMRLLMRREQVLKLCCNQYLMKDTKFEKVDKPPSVRWHGPDYSENETQLEFLALRFKTIEIRDEFYDAVLKAQKNMTNDGQNEPEEKKEPIQAGGWGNQFKPKTGNWTCDGCYCSNDAAKTICPACNTPKDKTQVSAPKPVMQSIDLTPSAGAPKFSFGVQPAAAQPTSIATTGAATPSGWGDAFKPKTGSWNCEGCYVTNDASKTACLACNAPKDKTAVVPQKVLQSIDLTPSAGAPKFNFGIQPVTSTELSGNSSNNKNFSFGLQTSGSDTSFKTPSSDGNNSFSLNNSTFSTSGFSFGTTQNETVINNAQPVSSSFSLSNTPTFAELAAKSNSNDNTSTAGGFNFGGIEKGSFEFVFKPRSPAKPKSPCKSPGAVSEGEQTDDEYHEEENNTYFTPVVNLAPVDVKTGEEDEDILYSHRAKLYRFDVDTKEWKERGVGDIKILKHKINGKLRILMRRDQVHKICLNHALTGEIEYKMKDDKSWLFTAGDYSEGELEYRSFCIRFKTHEISVDFKQAVDDALGDDAKIIENGHGSEEDKAMKQEAKLIQKLKLPSDFYEYKNKDPCKGCRGCESDDFKMPTYSSIFVGEVELPLELGAIKLEGKKSGRGYKPKRVSFSVDDSPDIEKTTNVPTDSTKSIFSSTLNTIPTVQNPAAKTSIFGATPVEGANIFSGSGLFSGQKNLFGGNSNENKSIFGGDSSQSSESKTIFGGNSTPMFGQTTSTDTAKATSAASIFGSGNTLFGSASFNQQNTAPGSIFGGTPIFGKSNDASTSPSNKLSGSTAFTGTPVFGSISQASTFSFTAAAKDIENNKVADANGNKSDSEIKDDANKNSPIPDILKSDSGPTFASIANPANNNAFSVLKKDGKDTFYGLTVKEDIFSKLAKQKSGDNTGEANQTGDADDSNANDDNYDPHYDPIIQLPDEIKLSTGEEEEIKLFGERAKLYRYCADTKEWKERGVGELKILHHPERGTYRFLMRREQIHKLVLNHIITADFQINPMNTSGKAYLWGAMNHSEEGGAVEKLAARFKNEDLANSFKIKVEECLDKLRSCNDLKAEED